MKEGQRKRPCPDCAFLKCSEQGNLGGSEASVYVGQILGPFWIPCHLSDDYRGKCSRFGEEHECAGAAAMRANLNIADKMPPQLLKVAPNPSVFASFQEFVEHHEGWFSWREIVSAGGPDQMLERELDDM